MKQIKDKKIIGVIAILIIIFIISLLTYGRNKKDVFKDEYMNNIFIEDNSSNEKDDYYENNNVETIEVSSNNGEKVDNDESKSKIVVEIKGEVNNPNVYLLDEGSIIKDLIDIAGGLTNEADISVINRAKELSNHELIIIYNINDEEKPIINNDITSNSSESDNIININTANESELRNIPGVGEVKANAIIKYRENNGGFKNIDEIKNVDGIGEKTFEKIKEFIKL